MAQLSENTQEKMKEFASKPIPCPAFFVDNTSLGKYLHAHKEAERIGVALDRISFRADLCERAASTPYLVDFLWQLPWRFLSRFLGKAQWKHTHKQLQKTPPPPTNL